VFAGAEWKSPRGGTRRRQGVRIRLLIGHPRSPHYASPGRLSNHCQSLRRRCCLSKRAQISYAPDFPSSCQSTLVIRSVPLTAPAIQTTTTSNIRSLSHPAAYRHRIREGLAAGVKSVDTHWGCTTNHATGCNSNRIS